VADARSVPPRAPLETDTTLFAENLFFPESPRWHDGALWLSDIRGRTVHRFDVNGDGRPVAVFEDDPSGLGWDAEGRLYVACMRSRRVLRVTDDDITEFADLSALEPFGINDMAVAGNGTAFVTRFGFDYFGGGPFGPAEVIRVRPDGSAAPVGPPMFAPNGIALTPDESRLYVASPGAGQIMVLEDPLSEAPVSSVFADLPAAEGSTLPFATPDGICLDVKGGVWAADPMAHRVIRVDASGTLGPVVEFDPSDSPVAVALGGADRRTLFVAVVKDVHLTAPRLKPRGRVVSLPAGVAGC
jgi:sugar lactone lactonase YvrE